MNENAAFADDDIRFDRLVDGELAPDEYRALVASLDQEPGGWRNCALAFLEAQALASELGGVRRSLDLRPHECPAAAVRKSSPWLAARTLLAMAASFALAFGLGLALPRIWQPGGQDPNTAGNLVKSGPAVAAAPGLRHETLRPIGNVRLVMNGASGEETATSEVPVYEIGQNIDEYLSQTQPGLDPYVVQWLEQQGHHVEVEQQLVPGRFEDGRPMYVPVEQYRITPVRRSY